MRKKLQNYQDSTYERPDQKWVCGKSATGCACLFGPHPNGKCSKLADCRPLKQGDRWICNRSSLRGGECEEGPSPEGKCCKLNICTPVLSLRAKRGRTVFAMFLLTLGIMILVMSHPARNEILTPGPLASAHALILKRGDWNNRCAACHAAGAESFAAWTKATIGNGPISNHATQSALCMECHQDSIQEKFALNPHSADPERLNAITFKLNRDSIANYVTNTEGSEHACASCHQEHHGADFKLTKMHDASCQTCHQQQFESFSKGHPEFKLWPFRKRPPIAFSHSTHIQKHFPKEKQEFVCAQCHVSGSSKIFQLSTGYEKSCASCHSKTIETSLNRGLPFIALPTIDAEILAELGLECGEWPEWVSGDFEGAFPPFMKLLLAADPKANAAMQRLGYQFEIIDIDLDEDEHLVAVTDLVWGIKRLLLDLLQQGHEAIRQRLAIRLGREISDSELHELTAHLSPDTIRLAIKNWFPNLETELAIRKSASQNPDNKNQPIQIKASELSYESPSIAKQTAKVSVGGWYVEDSTYSIRYQPIGHADRLMAAWINLIAKASEVHSKTEATSLETILFREIAKPTFAGQCLTCHSVDEQTSLVEAISNKNSELQVHWRANDPRQRPRGFTKFSHRPHLVQPQLQECTSCHKIDKQVDGIASYSEWNSARYVSGFLPIQQQDCQACHNPTGASDRCTECHRYHLDPPAGSLQRLKNKQPSTTPELVQNSEVSSKQQAASSDKS